MKKIFKKLKKLFPDNHIALEQMYEIKSHSVSDKIEEDIYTRLYISDFEFKDTNGPYSKRFRHIKELEDMLRNEIDNYK